MWRPPPPLRLKFLAPAAIADITVMSYYQRPHRGGRNRWGRSFSDQSNRGGRGHIVTGDSHLDSVRETNPGSSRGNFSNQYSFQPQQFGYNPRSPYPYNHQNQEFFRQPPPNPHPFNRYQPPRRPFDQNQAAKPFRPHNSKPRDFREWEYAKAPPPPCSDRFIVLSYNILADYLASTHRNLYFHIPYHMMNWEWRMRNLMFELGLWSADILCFQEVDRFHDLEQQLKSMGYSGIWKMRTGKAIDGCAIFWRTSRFKLLHEEYIEYNKHELRDNVAQICILELLSQNSSENTADPLKSSANSNKVVICNIHVLYNPKRGEIKLGQVRMLLERAHAFSKSWDDAPVVLCGDFNCTPKSPLYNFISEKKLDLSVVDRDKVSGQASAEIPLQTYNPNSGAQSGDFPARVPPAVDSMGIGMDKNDSQSDTKKQNNLDRNNMKDASVNSSQSSETMQDLLDMSCKNSQRGDNYSAEYDEVTEEIQHDAVGVAKCETGLAFSGKFSVNQMDDDVRRFSPGNSSCPENVCSNMTEMEPIGKDVTIHSNKRLDDIVRDDHFNRFTTDPESLESFSNVGRPSVPSQVDFSGLSDGIDIELEEKMDNLSLEELNKSMVESENIAEDSNAFIDALYGNQDVYPPNSGQPVNSDLDHSSKEFFSSQDSQFLLPSEEVLDDLSPSFDSGFAHIEQTTYDPCAWGPKEIATAAGLEDCKFLEHPLQLKSTYTEVKDSPGTRDSHGEPLVTSYNRRFLGTVDYIWRSEGLQTVRVLAPFPKQAMQWTPGFPTKKWASDHIALASELAFTKNRSNQ
ncbi:DNAse I-like superfamily protein, putative isoform 2 [Hibiscus syriacus]|uniref:DNAse I-like superfamily protein, putative isoform 2 n=1 Tax=Hibiscus syriacus TaxID=106335 RepID=A0A6A3B2J3_HIBSY|nr:carbon catabolite repressor protein 4 homolog 6-like [Hibiscus syriacus]KAE8711244.1 DNAse I-like superfamily protein, putative isoform 2 [Hibiscus syriacus]